MLRSFVAAALLVATAAPAAEPPKRDEPEKAADPRDKIICKRFVETGSLVKGYRTCKTKREWDRERDDLRTNLGTSTACPSGEGAACR